MHPHLTAEIITHRPYCLSEIAEASCSSRSTLLPKDTITSVDGMHGTAGPGAHRRDLSINYENAKMPSREHTEGRSLRTRHSGSIRTDLESRAPSATSLPLCDIPKRRSSMSVLNHFQMYLPQGHSRHAATSSETSANVVSPGARPESPVKHAFESGAQSSEAQFQPSHRTFVRTGVPPNLFEGSDSRHPRLEMSTRLQSPLFVGGGTVEGQVELKIDVQSSKKTRAQPLFISTLSVDVIGVEEVEGTGRRIFLALATELFNRYCPPPLAMVTSRTPQTGPELYWQTKPATTSIPFSINLPLKLGPPRYSSRKASIRYILTPSVVLKLGDRRLAIRQMRDIQMLTIHDPERALTNLPCPLVATEVLTLRAAPKVQTLKITGGLHRQTWVNGGLIFVDVYIVNNTDRAVKKIEIQLQKSVLWFTHSAAAVADKRSNNLRLPDRVETETVVKNTIKKCKDWEGIFSQSSETRTCEVEVPKGQVTIGECRFFEVRYFVKIIAFVSRAKSVAVQLPVTIIHINSLDVLPNSLSQVATSIAAKRSQRALEAPKYTPCPPHTQGQAFSIARQRSLDQAVCAAVQNQSSVDVDALTRDLDESPRRAAIFNGGPVQQVLNARAQSTDENARQKHKSCRNHSMLRPSCYHCHLSYLEHATKNGQLFGPRLPRLQVSTSGLGFSETEFELPPDTPRKVMLSEQDRRMINQQRELRLQQAWTHSKPHRGSSTKSNGKSDAMSPVTWRNVASTPLAGRQRAHTKSDVRRMPDKLSSERSRVLRPGQQNLQRISIQRRSRSMTFPEQSRPRPPGPGRVKSGMRRPEHAVRSVDRGHGLRKCLHQGETNAHFPSRPSSIQSEHFSMHHKVPVMSRGP